MTRWEADGVTVRGQPPSWKFRRGSADMSELKSALHPRQLISKAIVQKYMAINTYAFDLGQLLPCV